MLSICKNANERSTLPNRKMVTITLTPSQQHTLSQILQYLAVTYPGMMTEGESEITDALYYIAADEIINQKMVNVISFQMQDYIQLGRQITSHLLGWTPPTYSPLWGLMQKFVEITDTENSTKEFFKKAQEIARKVTVITITNGLPK